MTFIKDYHQFSASVTPAADREYNQKLYPRTRDVSSPLPEDINNNNSIDMRLNM